MRERHTKDGGASAFRVYSGGAFSASRADFAGLSFFQPCSLSHTNFRESVISTTVQARSRGIVRESSGRVLESPRRYFSTYIAVRNDFANYRSALPASAVSLQRVWKMTGKIII